MMARQLSFGRSSNAAASTISPLLVSESHKWDDYTFYVPLKVPSISNTATKYHFFLACEKNVRRSLTKNKSKLNFFTSMIVYVHRWGYNQARSVPHHK